MFTTDRDKPEAVQKKRKACLAFLLSLFTPGLGQIYNTQLVKGLIFFVLIEAFYWVLEIYRMFDSFLRAVLSLSLILLSSFFVAIEASVTARRKGVTSLRSFNRWYFYILFAAIGGLLTTGIEATVKPMSDYKAYSISSGGMLPTVLIGDRVIVDLAAYKQKAPARGDVIIFKFPRDPRREFIKRVVAVGGDVVEMKDKNLFLNGKLLEEPYAKHLDPEFKFPGTNPRDTFGPITVPENKMFVLGDNRDYSHDSRYWGFVDRAEVVGKVLYVYFSLDKDWHVRTERLGLRLD